MKVTLFNLNAHVSVDVTVRVHPPEEAPEHPYTLQPAAKVTIGNLRYAVFSLFPILKLVQMHTHTQMCKFECYECNYALLFKVKILMFLSFWETEGSNDWNIHVYIFFHAF